MSTVWASWKTTLNTRPIAIDTSAYPASTVPIGPRLMSASSCGMFVKTWWLWLSFQKYELAPIRSSVNPASRLTQAWRENVAWFRAAHRASSAEGRLPTRNTSQ